MRRARHRLENSGERLESSGEVQAELRNQLAETRDRNRGMLSVIDELQTETTSALNRANRYLALLNVVRLLLKDVNAVYCQGSFANRPPAPEVRKTIELLNDQMP